MFSQLVPSLNTISLGTKITLQPAAQCVKKKKFKWFAAPPLGHKYTQSVSRYRYPSSLVRF
jgi:hypothetical protein